MGQTVYLLFDASSRLVRTTTGSQTTGAIEPMGLFFEHGSGNPNSQHCRAIELDPIIIEHIRPEVWIKLSGHSVYTADGLQVDDLDTIQARETALLLNRTEALLVDTASQLGVLDGAFRLLGENFPASAEGGIARYAEILESHLHAIREIKAGRLSGTVNQVLADLAGKRLPL